MNNQQLSFSLHPFYDSQFTKIKSLLIFKAKNIRPTAAGSEVLFTIKIIRFAISTIVAFNYDCLTDYCTTLL